MAGQADAAAGADDPRDDDDDACVQVANNPAR